MFRVIVLDKNKVSEVLIVRRIYRLFIKFVILSFVYIYRYQSSF